MSVLTSVAATLEIAFNRALEADPHSLERLESLDGGVLDIHLREFRSPLRLRVADGRFEVDANPEPEEIANVTLAASLATFARAALDPSLRGAGLASAGIDVSGDTEMAAQLSDLLNDADFDIEEPLSKIIGDSAAYRVGQFARDIFGWGRKSAGAAAEDAVRYLRDETGELVTRDEVDQWMDAVDQAVMGVDRAAARIDRLEKRADAK